MDGSGALSNPMKQGFISLTLGLFNHLENQILERKGSSYCHELETVGFFQTSPFQDIVPSFTS
jgi:hypothetical protein